MNRQLEEGRIDDPEMLALLRAREITRMYGRYGSITGDQAYWIPKGCCVRPTH